MYSLYDAANIRLGEEPASISYVEEAASVSYVEVREWRFANIS